MANRILGCECRGIANSPLLRKEELPKVASARLRFRVVGSSLEASVNNVIYASAIDTVNAVAGKAGPRMNQTIVRMENFKISKP